MSRFFNFFSLCLAVVSSVAVAAYAEDARLTDGMLVLNLRSQAPTAAGDHATKPVYRTERWDPAETAIVVCDMWDSHHCYNAVQRAQDMAPRMNTVLKAAREAGLLIIHAPSDCVEPYADHPARRRAQEAPMADNVPPEIDTWCDRIPSEEEAVYPLDQSDGGEDDDPEVHRRWEEELKAKGLNPRAPWTGQMEALEIDDRDAISDHGVEIWNLLEARGIENVLLLGVHTNMCVLGRPFGLRQMAQHGRNVALVRDLTDTMYNPAMWPYVNHHTGTDRIVEHIEKYVCPTIESSDLIGGAPHRFFDDTRPTIAVVVSEFEYESYKTLPEFAHEHLGKEYRVRYILNDDREQHTLAGLEQLETADLMILSAWRRALPPEQLESIADYIESGRPVVAIRTASHAFATRDGQTPAGRATWPEFDREILHANYTGHYGNHRDQGDPPTKVWIHPEAEGSPLVEGLPSGTFLVDSWLYKMAPLENGAQPLLMGQVADQEVQPVAWTVERDGGQRIFYTSLGSQADFEHPAFVQLLNNAIEWAK